jgi:hypothetical protein
LKKGVLKKINFEEERLVVLSPQHEKRMYTVQVRCSRISKSFPNGMDIGIYMAQVMGNPTVPFEKLWGGLL